MSDDQTLRMQEAFTGAPSVGSHRPARTCSKRKNDCARMIWLERAGALWNGRRQGVRAASARRARQPARETPAAKPTMSIAQVDGSGAASA